MHKENKPEPLIATPLPDRPRQVVATDLFELKGIEYLVVINYFLRYIEVAAMKKTTKSSEVTTALKSIFPEKASLDKCDQTMVLNLTVQNAHTILLVVQGFPSQTDRMNVDLEP